MRPSLPRSLDLGGVDLPFFNRLAHRRRQHLLGHIGPCRPGDWTRTGPRSGFAAAAGVAGGGSPAPPPLLAMAPSTAPTLTVSPDCAEIASKTAAAGRRHLDRHLVGFELDERLVHLHRLSGLFKPPPDRRLADRFAQVPEL